LSRRVETLKKINIFKKLHRQMGTLKKITTSEIDQEGGDPEEDHHLRN
jgi:hypothetical protein